MPPLSDRELLEITHKKYAECGKTDPEACDRVVRPIVEVLRKDGKPQIAVEAAGNIATAELRNNLIAEIKAEF